MVCGPGPLGAAAPLWLAPAPGAIGGGAVKDRRDRVVLREEQEAQHLSPGRPPAYNAPPGSWPALWVGVRTGESGGMYRVTVTGRFSAVHGLRYGDGRQEPPHEHQWSVEVCFAGPELDRDGLLVDFVEELRGGRPHVLAPDDPFRATEVAIKARDAADTRKTISL